MSSDAPSAALQAIPRGRVSVGPLSAGEVESWLSHCAACFGAKRYAPPRSYFDAHLNEDPMRDLNGVAVAHVEEERASTGTGASASASAAEGKDAEAERKAAEAGQASEPLRRHLASTARVLVRRAYLEGKQVCFGGVGDVCTAEAYRGRGLAALCLHRALDYCRRLRLQLAALHANETFAPLYAKHGFASIPRWLAVKSDFESERDGNIVGEGNRHGAFALRLMPVEQVYSPGMLPQFQRMYDSYSSRFNGPLVRSDEYWQQWVRADLTASVGARHRFPCEIYAAYEEWDGSTPAAGDYHEGLPEAPIRFLAYMFLQREPLHNDDGEIHVRDRVYIVREYAATPAWVDRPDGGRQMFLSLLTYAVRQMRHKFAQSDPQAAATSKFSVQFPLPLVRAFNPPLRVDEEKQDAGWLWRALPVNMDPSAPEVGAHESSEPWRDSTLTRAPIRSPFAAAPFVLHHHSEPITATSAEEMLEEMKKDAKDKLVFWQTDAF